MLSAIAGLLDRLVSLPRRTAGRRIDTTTGDADILLRFSA
jgi:hypothetical protein